MSTQMITSELDSGRPALNANNSADSQKVFRMFASLPNEICVMILQQRLDQELVPPIRTLISLHDEPNLLTKGIRTDQRGLWHTGNNRIRGEVERRSTVLPARQLTFPGNSIYHMDKGFCGRSDSIHQGVGIRPIPKDTLFYMEYDTSLSVFRRCNAHIETSRADWALLTNLLWDYQTFRTLFQVPRPLEQCMEEFPPFRQLPGLKVLYLGFARRWTEVMLVEGPSPDGILLRVEPVVKDNGKGEKVVVLLTDESKEVELHEGLKDMIVKAFQESREEVRALRGQGIEVYWAVVKDEGITRRLDLIEGYNLLEN